MNKLGFTGLRGLEKFKSVSNYGSAHVKTFSVTSRPYTDSVSSGSFANLKLAAEKMVKEQATVKTDLEIASSKLKKSTEHIHSLEEKLQIALNENAKLKVKLKEDEKLWESLDSKQLSTKTFCDQLMETLHQLASQVQDAEKDKDTFQSKMVANSSAIDELNHKLNSLASKLEYAEDTVRCRDKELKELKTESDTREQIFKAEVCKISHLSEEKDSTIKELEERVRADKLDLESLNAKMADCHISLQRKEEEIKGLMWNLENLEKEKSDIRASNEQYSKRLQKSLEGSKDLENVVQLLAENVVELDEKSVTLSKKLFELNSVHSWWIKLVEKENELASMIAEKKYKQIHTDFVQIKSDKDTAMLVNQQLNERVAELHRAQESAMVQHAEELRLSEERIRILESEVAKLSLEKINSESLVTKLEHNITDLSNVALITDKKMQELMQNMAALELESKDGVGILQLEIQIKEEKVSSLHKEVDQKEKQIEAINQQVSQLQTLIEEKEQLIGQHKVEQKERDNQIHQLKASLSAAEKTLAEATKQHCVILESKQLELSRHLKEISQKNDQAINEIRRKYELEKLEILNQEKEKVEKLVGELEAKCELKMAECKAEAEQKIQCIQEEHNAVVSHMNQEHEGKESSLKITHIDEVKRIQIQSENELKEKTKLLRNEHEAEVESMRRKHEDECKRLQDELNLQKTKEDRQRALLQLQWKVMSNNTHEDQEVDSKKDCPKRTMIRNSDSLMKGHHISTRAQSYSKDTPSIGGIQKVDVVSGSVIGIPNHRRKVTRHEYEVETSNGQTITKRRKTRSTVMFEDPRKNHKIRTPRIRTPKEVKGVKEVRTQPSNIDDLFCEGSLNPYDDDPYAFG